MVLILIWLGKPKKKSEYFVVQYTGNVIRNDQVIVLNQIVP